MCIDNDTALCLAWKIKAEFIDEQILCFNSVHDFEKVIPYLPKETPIYIDSDLGNNCLGEYESKRLYDAGFNIIFLSTGQNVRQFPNHIGFKMSLVKVHHFREFE